MTGQKTSLHSI